MTDNPLDERLRQGIDKYEAAARNIQISQPPMRPANTAIAPSTNFQSDMDLRSQSNTRSYVQGNYGVARPRSLTLTIPLCNLAPPAPGWFTSINVFQYTRIQGWMITALVPGQISIDLQVSQPQTDQATAPVLTPIINDPNAATPAYMDLNGYSVFSFDTSSWFKRDITPPSTIHVIVNSAVTIQMASLGLYMIDLYGKTIVT